MRALWGELTPLYTAGPVLVSAVIALSDPSVALAATAALALVGTLGMTTAPASHVDRHRPSQTDAKHHRPLCQPGFRPMLIALLGVGAVLGTVEVAVPGFAQHHHAGGAAGLLLALFSVGSVAGGLAYGHRSWVRSPGYRLLALGVAVTVAASLLVFAPTVPVLAGLLVGLGVFVAPTLVTGYLLADELAPGS